MDFICTKDTESIGQFVAKEPQLEGVRGRSGKEGGESEREYLQGSGLGIDNVVFSNHHYECINATPQLLTLFITSLEERGEREEEEVKGREERRYNTLGTLRRDSNYCPSLPPSDCRDAPACSEKQLCLL